ncbi:MAG: hypothetical protein M3R11_13340, partial [Acidobacteriota bacterium]|nr:hypothetical protein [Acidobacteriota bacterium]
MNKLLTVLLTLSIAQLSFAQTKSANVAAVNNQSPSKTVVNSGESCGCELPVPDVIAVVNGSNLTLADIDTADKNLAGQVANLQKRVIEARRRELDLQINSKLLEVEARRRKTTTIKLLETEVIAKIQPATDAEAKAFYEANKARIEGDFDSVKNEITAYLRVQKEGEEAGKFAARLRAAARIKVVADNVTPPAIPADRQRVLVEVNEVKITSGNIEDSLSRLIYETQ